MACRMRSGKHPAEPEPGQRQDFEIAGKLVGIDVESILPAFEKMEPAHRSRLGRVPDADQVLVVDNTGPAVGGIVLEGQVVG